MPLYEYVCLDCGHVFEALQINHDDKPGCANCTSENLKKMISAHSSYSGDSKNRMPGVKDTPCCGNSPNEASCAGPGSCCGKS